MFTKKNAQVYCSEHLTPNLSVLNLDTTRLLCLSIFMMQRYFVSFFVIYVCIGLSAPVLQAPEPNHQASGSNGSIYVKIL